MMIDHEKVVKGLECCADLQRDTMHRACDVCPYNDDPRQGTCVTLFPLFRDALGLLQEQDRRWRELRTCITEMSTNGGTGSQQDVCRYLVHFMDVIAGRVNYGIKAQRENPASYGKIIR